MTIPLVPSTAAVDDVSTISAATVNSWRANMAKCLDGTGGSVGTPSTPATQILIGGSGIEMSGPFVLAAGGDMDVESGVTVQFQSGSTLDIDAGATVARQGAEVLSGSGATTAWRYSNGTDADGTYDVATDIVNVPAIVSTLRLYTLRSTTSPIPATGQIIRFRRNGTSFSNSVRIVREGPTIAATLGSGGFSAVGVVWDGTAWQVFEASGDVIVTNIA